MGLDNWLHSFQNKFSRSDSTLTLSLKNLYIVPSSFGIVWLLGAVFLYVLGITARTNNPVLLSFLMGALMLLSLFLTHFNLQGLKLKALSQDISFASENHGYLIELFSKGWRSSIKFRWMLQVAPRRQLHHVSPGINRVQLSLSASRRGVQLPGRLLIYTTAPLGLFYCWSYWDPPSPMWVAPARSKGPVQLINKNDVKNGQIDNSEGSRTGIDFFQTLKPLRIEEGYSRVDWKAKARGRGWLAKSFTDQSPEQIWIEPSLSLPLEKALEHLCYRVCEEAASNNPFGLKLPDGTQFHPQTGKEHLHNCLKALAEFSTCP